MESLVCKPNLFKIVARTHTETWHSMFLGWLLDPSGSHGLKDFSLKRLLVALTNPILQEKQFNKASTIAKIAAVGELQNALVIPNEDSQKEFSCSAGRIDVLIREITCDGEADTVILIEQKVHAAVDKAQCKKYADWLYESYPEQNKILLMLTPSDRLGATIEETTGDDRWNAIDYQTLHDIILLPIIRSPHLSALTLPLIEQYIDVLRVPSNGRKLAVTEEEKELALELYAKHKDAFEAILEALGGNVDIKGATALKETPVYEITINNTLLKGATVTEFYEKILKFIVDNNIATTENVPYETSTKRYLIAKQPHHQRENPFRVPIEYKGYFMEGHKGSAQAIKDIMRYLKAINCDARLSNNIV